MSWAALLAGALAGAAGAMGLGGGGVLLIYLTVFAGMEQLTAQGVNLLFFLPCALLALLLHAGTGLIRWKTALPCAAFGLLGALGGSLLAGRLGGDILSRIFAAGLILLGLMELFKKDSAKSKDRSVQERKDG